MAAASRILRTTVTLAAILVLVACGLGPSEPVEVTLAELAADHERYDGLVVATEGLVRSHDDPLHYWIEDEAPNRVELRPDDEVAPLLGEHVRVVGEFTFDEDEGRVISVEDIDRVGEAPRASS
jgi:hypothetical protein